MQVFVTNSNHSTKRLYKFLIDFEVEQAIYRVKEVVLYCSVCSSQETYFQSDAYLCFILLVRGQEPQFKLFG